MQGQWELDPTTPAGQELLDSYVAALRALPPGVRTVVLPEGVFSATGPAGAALTDRLSAVICCVVLAALGAVGAGSPRLRGRG